MVSDPDRVTTRSELLPEEAAAGSDDERGQAEAILAESDERQFDRDAAPGTVVEHNRGQSG